MEAIKLLRERTGAGMVDCKKALDEVGGDLEKAVDLLRKKGIAKAAKREGRDATEGIVKIVAATDGHKAAMIEFNAETDFVVLSEQFQKFVAAVTALVEANYPADLEALYTTAMDSSTVRENMEALSGVIGEKLSIGHYECIATDGTVGGYIHAGGKIGSLVVVAEAGENELVRELAMQVAAANPTYVYPAEVDSTELDKERDVYTVQLKNEGKSEAMIAKIMEGKVNKYYESVCLVKQEYIKDDKKKVEQILNGKTVVKFVRYSL